MRQFMQRDLGRILRPDMRRIDERTDAVGVAFDHALGGLGKHDGPLSHPKGTDAAKGFRQFFILQGIKSLVNGSLGDTQACVIPGNIPS